MSESAAAAAQAAAAAIAGSPSPAAAAASAPAAAATAAASAGVAAPEIRAVGVAKKTATSRVSSTVFELVHMELVRLALGRCKGDRAAARKFLLEAGVPVGRRLAVKMTVAKSELFPTTLDAVKFLGKELWGVLFGKAADKLQTNYKGVYVLHDKAFKFARRISPLTKEDVENYAYFTCGLVRGFLASMGKNASVTVQVNDANACQFCVVDHDHDD